MSRNNFAYRGENVRESIPRRDSMGRQTWKRVCNLDTSVENRISPFLSEFFFFLILTIRFDD